MDLKLYGKAAYSSVDAADGSMLLSGRILPGMPDSQDTDTAKPWSGRLIFWGGGSAWVGRAKAETGFHGHHAIQVTLALEGGDVRLRAEGGDWSAYPAAIVAANQLHAFEANGNLVALIFIEPESRAGRALRERYRQGIAPLAAEALAGAAGRLAALYWQRAAVGELAECAREVAAQLADPGLPPARVMDKRIEAAIGVLRQRLDGAVAMADIAAAVNLSPERFRHLFLQETGVRFRAYVLWLRMEVANAAHAAGSSLTEASHAGGFADSAHFSRTFKRMFGVPAVDVRRGTQT